MTSRKAYMEKAQKLKIGPGMDEGVLILVQSLQQKE
jgi:hypothetical protein